MQRHIISGTKLEAELQPMLLFTVQSCHRHLEKVYKRTNEMFSPLTRVHITPNQSFYILDHKDGIDFWTWPTVPASTRSWLLRITLSSNKPNISPWTLLHVKMEIVSMSKYGTDSQQSYSTKEAAAFPPPSSTAPRSFQSRSDLQSMQEDCPTQQSGRQIRDLAGLLLIVSWIDT